MPDTVTHIQTIAQPVEVSVKVGMEIDSKGQKKPSVEIKIAHHLTLDEAKDGKLLTIIDLAVATGLSKCKDTIHKAMEEN